ncbi:MAG TPA: hypothetical protein VFT45_18755 [Longimicrobium sp.]|nr:hypothetical protein [Longimicrobium sp.]
MPTSSCSPLLATLILGCVSLSGCTGTHDVTGPDAAAASPGFATGSRVDKSAEGFALGMRWGSTENGNDALINYVDAEATALGGRLGATACATVEIYSQGKLVHRGANVCQNWGPGVAASFKSWRLYTPASPSARVRVRRGQNEIRVGYAYSYSGIAGSGCRTNMGTPGPSSCGTKYVSDVVR